MHTWGDKDVDWAGIDAAASYIGETLRKHRVDVRQYKEKFGTVRVYCSLGLHDLHQVHYPGYVFNQWPEWAWRLQFKFKWLVRILNYAVVPYHKWLYVRTYKKAVEKWPHLRDEIVCAADYYELLDNL